VQRGIAAATGLEAQLKWPNDVMIGRRKLAGVLAEGVRVGQPGAAVLVGVGINVHAAAHPPDVDARATSIEAELGRAPDRELVLAAVLEALGGALASLERDAAGGILDEWRALAPSAVGTRVEWQDANRPRAGITAGIDETGALLVRTTSGVERIIAGELQWALRG
jgi:BirA family biotin operon repressor/biotin-[acetyl-CoA-carboxylase] ligase